MVSYMVLKSNLRCIRCGCKYTLILEGKTATYSCDCGVKITVPRLIIGKKPVSTYVFIALQYPQILLESRGMHGGKLLAVSAILFRNNYFVDTEVIFERKDKEYIPRFFAYCHKSKEITQKYLNSEK